jgi:hypothetical protein
LFRAGEVRSILLWLTPAGNASTAGSGSFQPLVWSSLANITLTYNGEIFSRFDTSAYQLWNLSENEKVSAVNMVSQNAGSVGVTTAPSYWVELPFAQVSKELTGDE